jgi:hypothetical protein
MFAHVHTDLCNEISIPHLLFCAWVWVSFHIIFPMSLEIALMCVMNLILCLPEHVHRGSANTLEGFVMGFGEMRAPDPPPGTYAACARSFLVICDRNQIRP